MQIGKDNIAEVGETHCLPPIFILDAMRQVLPSNGSAEYEDPGHVIRSKE
jgi:hypothetical protein